MTPFDQEPDEVEVALMFLVGIIALSFCLALAVRTWPQ